MLPDTIRDEAHLDDLLSQPTPLAVEAVARLEGDWVILGVGGKMGPTLACMLRRALDQAGNKPRIYGVARFSKPALAEQLRSGGVEPVRCDLLDAAQVQRLPEAANVVGLLGMKFGATENAHLTWATNVLAPAHFCQRYRQARIVAFSTGNVYGFTPVACGGSVETDSLHPVGEYSWSAVGRERSYEHAAHTLGIPMTILRLNYAVEMRYGVLVDIGQRVLAGEEVDVTMGHLNAIWQGDASAMALAAFAQLAKPPRILNLSGPETLSVRRIAEEFGRLFGKPAHVTGEESPSAFLTNAQESHRLFGYPQVSVQRMVRWIADWLQRGLPTWGKPTHFQVRDGKY